MEVKSIDYFPEKRAAFFLPSESDGLLLGCFVLQVLEILSAPALFLGRWRMPVVFYELVKGSAMDDDRSRDVHILRFHVPQPVQASVLITLHVRIVVPRIPISLRGCD